MTRKQWKLDSEIGPLFLVASTKGLQGVFWQRRELVPFAPSLAGDSSEIRILSRAATQLEEYLQGTRREFDLPFDVEGTFFQKQVWNQLLQISYGSTLSYQELARRIDRAKAVRAVGTANGRNPLCIIVPCHRVIASDGTLGGYSGGLALKEALLRLEGKARASDASQKPAYFRTETSRAR